MVKSGTLARIGEAIRSLGYIPTGPARALASGRSGTIAAVVPTLDNAIFSRALQAMQGVLSAEGYQLLVAPHNYSMAGEAESVRLLMSRGIDGLMLVGAERAPELVSLLATTGIPVLCTWIARAGEAGVTVDNERAGWIAAEHLFQLGHRRIGMVTGLQAFNDRQKARLRGVRRFLAQAGQALPDWLVSQQPTTLAGGRVGCSTLLALSQPPTALIGGIDLIALGCVIESQARGLTVPGDISVVGIDDLDISAHMAPALTTVHIPTAVIGEEAGRMLIAMIRDRDSGGLIDLPVELVVRQTSGPPRNALR